MAFEAIDIQNISGFQSIKIPENFKIDDNKVYLKKIGNVLYLIPFHHPWQNLIDSVEQFSEDFMDERGELGEQNRENLD